jgi:membrane glycosyltransferase
MAHPMKMRQSLAQFEAAFREEAVEERERRERLRRVAAERSRARRIDKTTRHGNARFFALVVAMIATAVIVTIAMFQTLALLMAS